MFKPHGPLSDYYYYYRTDAMHDTIHTDVQIHIHTTICLDDTTHSLKDQFTSRDDTLGMLRSRGSYWTTRVTDVDQTKEVMQTIRKAMDLLGSILHLEA